MKYLIPALFFLASCHSPNTITEDSNQFTINIDTFYMWNKIAVASINTVLNESDTVASRLILLDSSWDHFHPDSLDVIKLNDLTEMNYPDIPIELLKRGASEIINHLVWWVWSLYLQSLGIGDKVWGDHIYFN